VNESELLLVIVVATALVFDFTNGFHDTANAMATSIATRALRPKVAVALCAALNFAGAFPVHQGRRDDLASSPSRWWPTERCTSPAWRSSLFASG
jgi:phosphate transporter family protein